MTRVGSAGRAWKSCYAGDVAPGTIAAEADQMSQTSTTETPPVVIKKYANRRLYNTATSSYVTLDDLSTMVKEGGDFVVYDAKTGEDITRRGTTCCRSASCVSSSGSTATACNGWCRAISSTP
jgi:hypothetical protein